MARCGCASSTCSCTVVGGTGIAVAGSGSATDPYILTGQSTNMKVVDSPSVDLTLTGNGTAQSPYSLRADLSTTPNPGGNVPSGTLSAYAGDTAPNGWLLCDGSEQPRTTYSALFAIIGTKYGAGNNTTTFNLPDMRGRMALGAGSGAGLLPRLLGAKGGQQDAIIPLHSHTSQADPATHAHGNTIGDNAGNHAHASMSNNRNIYTAGAATYGAYYDGAGGYATAAAGAHNHTISNAAASPSHSHTINAAGVTATDTNMPPWMALTMLIKT